MIGVPPLAAEAIGWLATAVFVSSYFFGEAGAVRRVQMIGAGLWMAYGVATAAMPVVVANALVLGAAAFAPRATGPASSAPRSAFVPRATAPRSPDSPGSAV
jgi:hypothetical protein